MAFKSIVVAAASILSLASAQYSGDGTFYGAGGAGGQGSCMLERGFNNVGVTVALNGAQYDNGMSCGKCVKLVGTGQGLGVTPITGPIYATVDNLCPECQPGDVDLGLGGDGRWKIQWSFVPCKEARESVSTLPPGAPNGGRMLRGAEEQPILLEPGYMVTPDGIKLIADVKAEGSN